MELSYIPRAKIAEHLEAGWRPALSAAEYRHDEYAVLMVLPVDPVPATASLVQSFTGLFERETTPTLSNVVIASMLGTQALNRVNARRSALSRKLEAAE